MTGIEWQGAWEFLRGVNWTILTNSSSTFATAIFTGLLVYYNHKLLRATRTAADAALMSANAARKSADVAEQSLLAAEDALVQLDGVTVHPSAKSGFSQDTVFTILVKNYGPGVAKNVMATARLGINGAPGLSVSYRHPTTLASHQTSRLVVRGVSPAAIDALAARREMSMYVDITYETVRGPMERRFLEVFSHERSTFMQVELRRPLGDSSSQTMPSSQSSQDKAITPATVTLPSMRTDNKS